MADYIREHDVPGWGRTIECDAHAMPRLLRNVPVNSFDERQVNLTVGQTLAQAERMLCTEGWAWGAKQLQQLAEEIEAKLPQPKDLRRMLAYRETGDELVVERLYSGQLDRMWRTRKRRWAPTQTVISIGAHWCTYGCSVTSTLSSGAVAVALAYLLEKFGYRTEILGLLTVNPKGDLCRHRADPETQTVVATIKPAQQALNLDFVAAALHPSVTYLFAKRMVTELTTDCPYKGIAHKLRCNDSASVFATAFMQATGKRIDFASDFVGSYGYATVETMNGIKALGGRIFDEEALQKIHDPD
jgi:hypothetical protein